MAIIKLEDLKKPILALSDDVNRAEKEMVANDDSYSRRNHIRALFAMIEGTIYILKQTVLIAASSGPGPLSIAELALLQEKNFFLTEKGTPRVKDQFPKTKDNLLFTKSCLEKAFGYSLDLNATPNNWKDFKEAIAIRNRITHPKGLQDFEVSKEESELAIKVGRWFDAFVVDWFKQFLTTHPMDKEEGARDKSKRDDYTM